MGKIVGKLGSVGMLLLFIGLFTGWTSIDVAVKLLFALAVINWILGDISEYLMEKAMEDNKNALQKAVDKFEKEHKGR